MPTLAASRALNAAAKWSYRPVAIFVGGTSGIGHALANKFAHITHGNAHIILVGRNENAANDIISKFPTTDQSKYEFLSCDVSLIKDTVDLCRTKIVPNTPYLNYLVMTAGFHNFGVRDETVEGLDKKMAVTFYSRWKFVEELLPLLRKGKAQGIADGEARVFSSLAAGGGGPVNLDDLGLKKTYSFASSNLQPPTYNDLMVEALSSREKDIAFIHGFPGVVNTNILRHMHWSLKVFEPLMWVLARSPDTAAEYLTTALTDPRWQVGGWHLSDRGEPVPASKVYTTDEAREKLEEHFKAVTNV